MNLSPDVRREEAGSLNSKVRIAKQTIYSTTYSHVGDEFLDSLTKELAATLDVQTVLIQRLLTLNEYRDLKENDGCPSIQIIDDTSCNTSRENSPSDTENNTEKARFLYIKASSSTLTSTSL